MSNNIVMAGKVNTQVVLLSLLWCLVEAHSQTAPYVTFMGETLPNHAYVDFSEVGLGGTADAGSGDELVCHSDLTTCCRGSDQGHWYFPNGTQLHEAGSNNVPIVERNYISKLDSNVDQSAVTYHLVCIAVILRRLTAQTPLPKGQSLWACMDMVVCIFKILVTGTQLYYL